METNFTNIKERILHYTDLKGFAKEKFFEDLGVTYGNFKGEAKKKALSSDVLAKIVTKYTDINTDWLLTGNGSALKEEKTTILTPNNATDGIPLIPVEAMAGFGNGHTAQIMEYDTERYVIPEFSELNVEFLIRMKGSSMIPKYNSGDLLGCRRLPMDTFFQWNKVYVIDTVQGALVKRVHKSEKPGHIICVSDNATYPPFELNYDADVNAIAIVLGVIRFE